MNQFLKKNKYWILIVAIILIASLLRLWQVDSIEIRHDHAINSFRAVGWLDYLTGEGQTSPIIWFGEIPWWGSLSFHDHPPLTFGIQYIFFSLFGDTDTVAILPFLISGIVTTFLLFFLFYRREKKAEALITGMLFAITSYAVWISRTGYLEGMLTVFITLSLFFFVIYIYQDQKKYLVWWWIAAALALMSKYTAVFLLPAGIVYLLMRKRAAFKQKEFWIGVLAFLIILSPVIIYNIMLFITRGHFDAALSSMVGMQPEDYSVLAYRSVDTNIFTNASTMWSTLMHNTSLGLLIIYCLSILYQMYKLIKKKSSRLEQLILFNLLFIVLMFLFTETSAWFFSIILPFLSITSALLLYSIWKRLQKKPAKIMFILIIISIIGYETFYTLNTNLLTNPIGPPGYTFSEDRFYKMGYNELDKIIRKNIISTLPQKRSIKELSDEIKDITIKNKDIILVDERIDWFSRMWYERRYHLYYDLPFIYLTDLEASYNSYDFDGTPLEFLKAGGAKKFWLIIDAQAEDREHEITQYTQTINEMINTLQSANIEPTIINDYKNEPSFYIYNFDIEV